MGTGLVHHMDAMDATVIIFLVLIYMYFVVHFISL